MSQPYFIIRNSILHMSAVESNKGSSNVNPDILEAMPQQPMSAYMNFAYETYKNYYEFLAENEKRDVHSKWLRMEEKEKFQRLRTAKSYKDKYLKDIKSWKKQFQLSEKDYDAYRRQWVKLKEKMSFPGYQDHLGEVQEEKSQQNVDLKEQSVKINKQTGQVDKCSTQEETHIGEANKNESLDSVKKSQNRPRLRSKRKQAIDNYIEFEKNRKEKEVANRLLRKQRQNQESDRQQLKTDRKEGLKSTIQKVTMEDLEHLKRLIQTCFGKLSVKMTFSFQKSD